MSIFIYLGAHQSTFVFFNNKLFSSFVECSHILLIQLLKAVDFICDHPAIRAISFVGSDIAVCFFPQFYYIFDFVGTNLSVFNL